MFKTIRRTALVLVLIASLAFNGLLLGSSVIFNAASQLVSAISQQDMPNLSNPEDLQTLTKELDEQKRVNRALKAEIAEKAKENADEVALLTSKLEAEKKISRQLRSETADLSESLAVASATNARVAARVTDVSERVGSRMKKAASRETAAMYGEAIPYWGVAVIVAATALELKDLCDTAIDMTELKLALDPNQAPDEEDLTLCAVELPTRSEIATFAKETPGKAWESAKASMPTLEEVKSFELPDVDWSAYGTTIKDKASAMGTSASEAAQAKWLQLQNWYNE